MSTKVSTDLIDLSSNVGGLVWAKGPTTDQPASATAGEMRVDTTTNTTVVYNGTQWKTLKETAFVAPPVPTHFLVVAGGGGSAFGNVSAGGGGAGGLRTSYGSNSGGGGSAESTTDISLNTAYTITVGDGGIGVINGLGGTGGDSIFSTITSSGGGGGYGRTGLPSGNGGDGGSGGGGSGESSTSGGNGVANQGYAGGGGIFATPSFAGGGGGGAFAIGGSATSTNGGNGGNGLPVSITGTAVTYAGGGGGGSESTSTPGSGGTGGGGSGGNDTNGGSSSGIFNTGGGAGGSGTSVSIGKNGGAGVVILRYPTADLPYFTTTGTLNTPSATDTVADATYPVTNLAYYKLDNNANDSGLSSGYIGQGGIFNGNGEIDTGIDLDTYDETWSISLWVKFIFNSSYRYIAGDLSAAGALNGFTIDTSPTGQIRFRFRNSSGSVAGITSTNTYGDGDWHHIAAVKDSSNNYLYVDGVQVGTVATVNGISHTTNIILGRVGAYNGFYNGTLDQVRIFPTSLSSSNVSLLYAETSATSSTLNYPVTATALYELSGNANDTGNTYNGTATNVEYAFNGTATDVTYGNGRFNEAANFNGSSSVITSSFLGTALNVSSLSFSLWFKTNLNDSTDRILISSYDGSGNARFYASLLNSGLSVVIYGSSATYIQNFINTVITGTWYHLSVIHTGTTTTVYLNNTAITPSSTSGSAVAIKIAGSPQPITIGQLQGYIGTYALNGSIDQVRIFSLALAAGDVEDLYNEHFQTKFTDGSDTALMFTGGTGDITFLDIDPNFAVDYLVVAGGGGGGYGQGAGAGAGGLRTSYGSVTGGGGTAESSLTLSTGTAYTVTIGAGGAGGVGYTVCCNGQDSIFSNITSTGGGAGGYYVNSAQSPGNSGGSGGGGGGWSGVGGSAASPTQGYAGGTAAPASNAGWVAGGGGGGAGAVGVDGTGSGSGANIIPGPGGAGLASSITGSSVTYAGGGGGSGINFNTSYNFAVGGTGGGGAGNGTSGTVNTGGGGGTGSWISSGNGGAGGSGIVIIRYPNTKTITVGAGLTATTAADGTDSVTTFTAGTGTITFS